MVDNLLSLVHDLLYCLTILEFIDEERKYILEVTMKAVNLIEDII